MCRPHAMKYSIDRLDVALPRRQREGLYLRKRSFPFPFPFSLSRSWTENRNPSSRGFWLERVPCTRAVSNSCRWSRRMPAPCSPTRGARTPAWRSRGGTSGSPPSGYTPCPTRAVKRRRRPRRTSRSPSGHPLGQARLCQRELNRGAVTSYDSMSPTRMYNCVQANCAALPKTRAHRCPAMIFTMFHVDYLCHLWTCRGGT